MKQTKGGVKTCKRENFYITETLYLRLTVAFTSRASSRASAPGSCILRSHNLEQKKTKDYNYYFQFDSITTSLIKPTIKIFIQIALFFQQSVNCTLHCVLVYSIVGAGFYIRHVMG